MTGCKKISLSPVAQKFFLRFIAELQICSDNSKTLEIFLLDGSDEVLQHTCFIFI